MPKRNPEKKTKKQPTSLFKPGRDLTIINAYGASEVRCIAISFDMLAAFYVSFNKTVEEFEADFNPWTRVNLFCAKNGAMWMIPTKMGCHILRYYLNQKASDRSADELNGFFRALPTPYDLEMNQMLEGNFLVLAQQAHEDLSANKSVEWWENGLESIWIPYVPNYRQVMMTSRLGVGITREGLIIRPEMSNAPQPPKPLILQ